MTIRGRYGRAYIEEGREGVHSTFESHERDRVGRKGGVPSVHTDDGRNSVLFCIREMRSRCSALARKPPPSCDRLRGDRDKWSRLKTSITRQSNKLEAARDRQLIYGPFFSPSPSFPPFARGHQRAAHAPHIRSYHRRRPRRPSRNTNGGADERQ